MNTSAEHAQPSPLVAGGGQPGALTYATPASHGNPRVRAAAIVMLGGLGLIFFGGCFLIGVMSSYQSPGMAAGPRPGGLMVLEVVLYLLAGGCFAGAVALIGIGVRWLSRLNAHHDP